MLCEKYSIHNFEEPEIYLGIAGVYPSIYAKDVHLINVKYKKKITVILQPDTITEGGHRFLRRLQKQSDNVMKVVYSASHFFFPSKKVLK